MGRRPRCYGLFDLCRHRSGWARCDQNMDWSGCKSAPLHADVLSHLPGSSTIQPLAASDESWHRLYFYFYIGADYLFLLLLLLLFLQAWTQSSIIESMVKFIWQHNLPLELNATNFPLEAVFLVVIGKKKWDTPPPSPLQSPAETTQLEVRELSQTDFWDISLHPTSVLSFSQISWPYNFWPLEHFPGQWHLRRDL